MEHLCGNVKGRSSEHMFLEWTVNSERVLYSSTHSSKSKLKSYCLRLTASESTLTFYVCYQSIDISEQESYTSRNLTFKCYFLPEMCGIKKVMSQFLMFIIAFCAVCTVKCCHTLYKSSLHTICFIQQCYTIQN